MDIPLSLFSLSMHGDLSFVLFVCAKNERAPVLVLGPILIFSKKNMTRFVVQSALKELDTRLSANF